MAPKSFDAFEIFRIVTVLNFLSAGDLPKYSKSGLFVVGVQMIFMYFIAIFSSYTTPIISGGSKRRVNFILNTFILLFTMGIPLMHYFGKVPQWKSRRKLEQSIRKMQKFLNAKECSKSILRARNIASIVIVAVCFCQLIFRDEASPSNLRMYNRLFLTTISIVNNFELLVYVYKIKFLMNSYSKVVGGVKNQICLKNSTVQPRSSILISYYI